MEIIYFLIPLSVLLVGGIVALFLWSVKSGQFDDLEGPAYKILMDEEEYLPTQEESKAQTEDIESDQAEGRKGSN